MAAATELASDENVRDARRRAAGEVSRYGSETGRQVSTMRRSTSEQLALRNAGNGLRVQNWWAPHHGTTGTHGETEAKEIPWSPDWSVSAPGSANAGRIEIGTEFRSVAASGFGAIAGDHGHRKPERYRGVGAVGARRSSERVGGRLHVELLRRALPPQRIRFSSCVPGQQIVCVRRTSRVSFFGHNRGLASTEHPGVEARQPVSRDGTPPAAAADDSATTQSG